MTDRRRLCGGVTDLAQTRRTLVAQARHAIEAGVEWVQVRERDLQAADLAAVVVELVALARGSHTRIVVNDRLDVAIACGAAGVHLRADSIPPAAARAIGPPGFVIGRSVHSLEEAIAAAPLVDYLIAGTIWATPSKPAAREVIGAAGLTKIVDAVRVPVLAIGGVTPERLREVAAAGAAGAAGIGLFMAGEHGGVLALDRVVREARRTFDTPGSAS